MSTIALHTMRAMITTFGEDSALREADVPVPAPGPTEIRVAVHAAGVNPVDWKSRTSGGFGGWTDTPILGWDLSGVVDAVGGGVTHVRPGDAVFGLLRFPSQAGAYSEHVVAPSRQFAVKPDALSHVEAAALPLAGLTAWQALHDTARVQPGERVLVHAAAGGVGHLAVQIAKALGAAVIGTTSAGKHDLVRSLGAEEVVDYRTTLFETAVAPVDVVLDTIGGDYAARSLDTLRDGGRLVSLTGPDEPGAAVEARAAERGIDTGWTLVEPDRAGMLALAELVGAGKLRPVIAETFPLAEADAAHAIGRTGRTTGKLVLRVRD
jgi:NADPH:quinone reductase-like Zn-dependent oxidoreductase